MKERLDLDENLHATSIKFGCLDDGDFIGIALYKNDKIMGYAALSLEEWINCINTTQENHVVSDKVDPWLQTR